MTILSLSFIVNLAAIVAGGCLGTLFRGRCRIIIQQVIVRTTGLVILTAGGFGLIYSFFPFSDAGMEPTGWLLIAAALVVGGILGAAWNVERGLDRTSAMLLEFASDPTTGSSRKPSKPKNTDNASRKGHGLDNVLKLPVYNLPSARSGHRFADGFAIGTVYLIASALTLHGIVSAGGAASLLYWKALLDFVVMAALASVYGTGVTVSALSFVVTVALIDLSGGIWDSAGEGLVDHYDNLIEKYSSSSKAKGYIKELPGEINTLFTESKDKMTAQIAVAASVISIVLGLDLAIDKKWKAANFIPAVLVPIIYYVVIALAKVVEGIVLSGQAAKAAVILPLFIK